jgi:3-hydroxyisobutyrate dehydrogenase-like beta-hydroxyacid dehydrogenase
MKPTIAIIAAGAMGSAVARRLTEHGVTVLTSLTGRSAGSRARAEACGMRHAEEAEIVERSKIILSIVPPADAVAVAERFAGPLKGKGRVVFADCNAISVPMVAKIAGLVEGAGAGFVDGAIIGLPPKGDDPGPTFYFAGDNAGALTELSAYGLRVRTMDGPVGAAKALKLSYAGITKGLVAIGTSMILAAERAGAGQALYEELAISQTQLLERFSRTLPGMYPKAYRWVEEMHAISDFIGAQYPEARIFDGAAGLYERMASDVSGSNAEHQIIDAFLGRKAVAAR